MAKIRVKLRPSSIVGKEGTIYYQVSHRRIIRQITTKIRIMPEDWDKERQCIRSSEHNAVIVQNGIDGDVRHLQTIIREFESAGDAYTSDDIIARFRSADTSATMLSFMKEQIRGMRICNRLGTAQNYEYAMRRFSRFLGGRDIQISSITERLIERFNASLMECDMVRNTISFYMRILRSCYNKAVRMGLAEQTYPFKTVYTGIDRTRKKAVQESVIARFLQLDLSKSASLAFTRDLFLFSFYTRGMSFVDMAYLKRDNIRNGKIRYIRRKTGQEIEIRIEPQMRAIIERYADNGRIYVFPILKQQNPLKEYSEYRIASSFYNRQLKRLCDMAGISQRLSFYTARHSWATAARDHHIPLSVISAGMGHTSERTTQIYLAMLENSTIDNANKSILESLFAKV